jgi:hypothetical protein
MRLSGTVAGRSQQLVYQADAGIDLPISEGDNIDADSLIRLNVAGGVDLGRVAILGELVNIGSTGEDDEFIHSVGVTGRLTGGSLEPSVSLVLPVDAELPFDVDFVIVLGLQAAIGSRY